MTANDSQDSMRQTVWRLNKLATSPFRLLTADGFLDRQRRIAPCARPLICAAGQCRALLAITATYRHLPSRAPSLYVASRDAVDNLLLLAAWGPARVIYLCGSAAGCH